jgi:hypothetical protein
MTVTGRELKSTVTEDGTLRLTLEDVTLEAPSPDEVIVKVEAAPINPSDLGLLLGPANVSTLRASGTAERPVLASRCRGNAWRQSVHDSASLWRLATRGRAP